MDTPPPAILIAFAGVLAAGSMLQTAAGFGFALLTIPLLLMLGCAPEEAIVLVSVGAAAQAVVGVVALRRHLGWKRSLVMILLACLALPAGVAVLGLLAEQDAVTVRRVFGAIVLLVLVVQVTLRVQPRERLHPGALVGAMLASGFMGGFCGMSGPPAVLWVMAHRWSNPESRATLWALFGGMTPVQLLLLQRQFGPPVLDAAALGLVLLPAVLLGVLPGLWIGHRIPKPRLRMISFIVLAGVALSALLRP